MNTPSPRQELLESLVRWALASGWEGGPGQRTPDGRAWQASLVRPEPRTAVRVLVFSLDYLSVSWFAEGLEGLPQHDSRVFATLRDATEFLHKAFVERQAAAALAVPVRPLKRPPSQLERGKAQSQGPDSRAGINFEEWW